MMLWSALYHFFSKKVCYRGCQQSQKQYILIKVIYLILAAGSLLAGTPTKAKKINVWFQKVYNTELSKIHRFRRLVKLKNS